MPPGTQPARSVQPTSGTAHLLSTHCWPTDLGSPCPLEALELPIPLVQLLPQERTADTQNPLLPAHCSCSPVSVDKEFLLFS